MRCNKCGYENSNNANFCRKCGSPLSNANYNTKKSTSFLTILILTFLVVIIGCLGVSAYVVYFDNSPTEIIYLSNNGADVKNNLELANNLPNSDISNKMIDAAKNGVPIYKIGDGKGPTTVISAGIFGDQLVPTVAAMNLINYLDGRKIKGTVYIIPFTSPGALSENTKLTNGVNLNTVADNEGTLSNDLVKFSISNKASAVGDFHETGIGKNPGETTIMCSQYPTYASYQLANNMSSISLDTTSTYLVAGVSYDGAVEDVLNLNGTPAVTPLVLVPNHGKVYDNAVKESYNQMMSLIIANGNLDPNDNYLKIANMDIDGFNL